MRYIGALDIGTTNVRFHIFDEEGNTIASSTEKVRFTVIVDFQKYFLEEKKKKIYNLHSAVDHKSLRARFENIFVKINAIKYFCKVIITQHYNINNII